MSRRVIIGKSKIPTGIPGGFKMQIQTTTANQVFTLPTYAGSTYNATVLWGDGTQSSVTGHNINNTKTYETVGTYDIEIKGRFPRIYFNNEGSKLLVKKILSWGGDDFAGFESMSLSFTGCSNLNELATGGIKAFNGNIYTMSQAFKSCSSLTSLPADLFSRITNDPSFYYCFNSTTSLTSIPADLFKNIPSVIDFTGVFAQSAISSIPPDLFKYNTLISSFNSAFVQCAQLQSVPDDLFKHNILATNFTHTFFYCTKLRVNPNMFGTIPDFGTRVMDFSNCFNRTSFTGTQGTAPALWSATMNANSTKETCFGGAGNSATSLTNYASIPAAWK